MPADRTPVNGPFRIHVDPTPTGAALDISHYLTALVLTLAQAADEDGPGVLAELVNIAELDRSARHQGIDSPATHERDACVEEFLKGLSAGELPVYGAQVMRLADRLREIAAPKAVSSRPERRTA
ncbi:hypothetical protein ACFWM0_14785 [Streptomyces sp. NPDC058405]|uniref:hypothetical protein n=1 Tax=Streptomyces sp. NPDC058405 TaxID=3346482 RepID=UPI0036512ADD